MIPKFTLANPGNPQLHVLQIEEVINVLIEQSNRHEKQLRKQRKPVLNEDTEDEA